MRFTNNYNKKNIMIKGKELKNELTINRDQEFFERTFDQVDRTDVDKKPYRTIGEIEAIPQNTAQVEKELPKDKTMVYLGILIIGVVGVIAYRKFKK